MATHSASGADTRPTKQGFKATCSRNIDAERPAHDNGR